MRRRSNAKVQWTLMSIGITATLFFAAQWVGALVIDPQPDPLVSRPPAFNEESEDRPSLKAESLFQAIKKNTLRGARVLTRNLFEEWTGPDSSKGYYLEFESKKPNLPLVYKGFLQDPDGNLIAQVNFEGRSYFVKSSGVVQGWKILSISRETLVAANPAGQTVSFPYRQSVEAPSAPSPTASISALDIESA